MSSNINTGSVGYGNNFHFETGIGPITDRILNSILDKLTSDNFKDKLMDKIVDPVTMMINDRIRPYVYIGIVMYAILVILLLIIIYMLYKKSKS
ncbi:hypothetical protein [Acanthamoeba castellanii mimivirus]|uniref:Uncharacterized protein n=3 Tax=Mimivirus TaxID=315393 RepID=A0A0G2Y663_MIMIV|nr:hypothetical protein MIMI_gp0525 [Acanthamoeba polyphaga mimivirus]AEQ60678.1 putative membrane protein [Acanthamoeba castellanii mamavirus]AHA45369.1 hypothetical protein HIRU_S463 [Hirudovirus strain Sangsue]AHJ40159.1 hypothetical protein [Samba virus]QTF49405.1 hypothetical protein [Mimivirus reunion]WMV61848.1 hypothetical protein qu_513 [Mimivirus sp.]BAV61595.1 hypothetical protein [Acanthamoeba castellanii mimivirus]